MRQGSRDGPEPTPALFGRLVNMKEAPPTKKAERGEKIHNFSAVRPSLEVLLKDPLLSAPALQQVWRFVKNLLC